MEMADEKWKIAGDLCRCCLAVGSHNKLGIAKFNDKASGDNEDFANMLLENLGLTLLPVKCVLSEITYTICNPCVERLRDAVSFRKQVQLSEEKFWNMYGRNMLIAIEPIVVKVEDVAPEDAYKGASDDDFNMDDFSDDDTKLNFIEIKAETKKSKGKAKAGIKGTATKKPPTRKMAARKTKTKSMMDAESVKAQKQKVKTEKTEAIKTEEEEEGSPAEETKPPVKRKKGKTLARGLLTATTVAKCASRYTSDIKSTKIGKHQPESVNLSCEECGKTMKSETMKRQHKLYHHKLEKCKHCSSLFTRSKMPTHVKAEHPGDMPTCGICGYQNIKQCYVNIHQRMVHMKEKNHKCDRCELRFFDKYYLHQHQKSHSNERPYQCDVCRKKFKKTGTLKLHRKIHTGEKGQSVLKATVTTSAKAKWLSHPSSNHKQTQNEKQDTASGVYCCEECGKTTKSKVMRRKHRLLYHKFEKCKHCPLVSTRYKLLSHIKTEHPSEISTCGICGYQNPKQANIEIHQRNVHMKEKNFKCDQCEMSFSTSQNLREHQTTHSGERAFKCDFCHKRFKQSKTLYSHRKIHTGEKDKVCKVCGQAFVQKASLNYHMAKYHPGTTF